MSDTKIAITIYRDEMVKVLKMCKNQAVHYAAYLSPKIVELHDMAGFLDMLSRTLDYLNEADELEIDQKRTLTPAETERK